MNKLIISIFIISFWLLMPVPFQLMDMNNYETISTDITEVETELSGYSSIDYLFNTPKSLIGMYFQILFIGIPGAPNWANIGLGILKLISILVVYLLLRGD